MMLKVNGFVPNELKGGGYGTGWCGAINENPADLGGNTCSLRFDHVRSGLEPNVHATSTGTQFHIRSVWNV